MIELIGLGKTYDAATILSDASLTVRGGESVALVGTNGSGKTTTLRCAVGLARPDRGRILIDGIDMAACPCEARTRLSYLAQRTDFPGTLTVREILSVVAKLRGTSPHTVDREIALCGLSRLADRTAGQLSGGERQRVAIATLFIPDVTTYLLDEPTMNLDPGGVRLLVDRLAAARDEGRAVVFTTHGVAGLDELTTSVAWLRNGRITPLAEEFQHNERHISIAFHGPAQLWADSAQRGGARRAWPRGGRLHAIIADGVVSSLLARLEDQGARITNYRTETALAAALERLNEENHHDEMPPPHSVDRCVAAGWLWHGAAWARTDSPGPR